MIEMVGRLAFPRAMTTEDWAIMLRVPSAARWLYMLGDTADAALMFAYVDQQEDWRRERENRERIDRIHRIKNNDPLTIIPRVRE